MLFQTMQQVSTSLPSSAIAAFTFMHQLLSFESNAVEIKFIDMHSGFSKLQIYSLSPLRCCHEFFHKNEKIIGVYNKKMYNLNLLMCSKISCTEYKNLP